MKTFEKVYSFLYLLFGWVAIRFLLFSSHGMKDWPDLLAVAGAILVIISVMRNHYALARMASIGYVVSFLVAYLLQKDSIDVGGGAMNNIRIIWTIAYVALIILGVYMEAKRNKRIAAAKARK